MNLNATHAMHMHDGTCRERERDDPMIRTRSERMRKRDKRRKRRERETRDERGTRMTTMRLTEGFGEQERERERDLESERRGERMRMKRARDERNKHYEYSNEELCCFRFLDSRLCLSLSYNTFCIRSLYVDFKHFFSSTIIPYLYQSPASKKIEKLFVMVLLVIMKIYVRLKKTKKTLNPNVTTVTVHTRGGYRNTQMGSDK